MAGEWLFNVFAAAAVRAAEDGGVWKGYGKFNLSAPSRNQAPDGYSLHYIRLQPRLPTVAASTTQGYSLCYSLCYIRLQPPLHTVTASIT